MRCYKSCVLMIYSCSLVLYVILFVLSFTLFGFVKNIPNSKEYLNYFGMSMILTLVS